MTLIIQAFTVCPSLTYTVTVALHTNPMHRLSPDTCTLLAFCRKVLVVLYYGSHVFISVAQYMFGGVCFCFCLFKNKSTGRLSLAMQILITVCLLYSRYLPGMSVRGDPGQAPLPPLCLHRQHQVHPSGMVCKWARCSCKNFMVFSFRLLFMACRFWFLVTWKCTWLCSPQKLLDANFQLHLQTVGFILQTLSFLEGGSLTVML